MHCLTVAYPLPGNPERFRRYYEDEHIPLARTLPGLERMEVAYPHPLTSDERAPFCVFRAYFGDVAAMEAALNSEIGRMLAADVPNYSPDGVIMYHNPVDFEGGVNARS